MLGDRYLVAYFNRSDKLHSWLCLTQSAFTGLKRLVILEWLIDQTSVSEKLTLGILPLPGSFSGGNCLSFINQPVSQLVDSEL